MRFVAYGLTIESEFPIPGLSACIDEPQVIIRKATLEQPAWDGYSPRSFTSMLGGLRIYWPAAGTFQICHGNEILVDPRPDVEEAAMRLVDIFLGYGASKKQLKPSRRGSRGSVASRAVRGSESRRSSTRSRKHTSRSPPILTRRRSGSWATSPARLRFRES